MQNYTDTARAIAVHLNNNALIEDFDMIEQGTVAKIATPTGHIIALSTEQDSDGEYITYSVYAPGDHDLADGPITTDGFEVENEDQATECMAEIVQQH